LQYWSPGIVLVLYYLKKASIVHPWHPGTLFPLGKKFTTIRGPGTLFPYDKTAQTKEDQSCDLEHVLVGTNENLCILNDFNNEYIAKAIKEFLLTFFSQKIAFII
jgi:hypothetical protein